MTGLQPRVGLLARRAVVGVHEFLVGPRQQGRGRVAEQPLERGVDALEVPVEPGDAEQVLGHLEDAVRLALGLLAPALQLREGGHRVVHAADELGPCAREGGGGRAMAEPVVLDGHVHRADLRGEVLGRDLQVTERRRDLADLVAARVGHAGRQLPR